MAVVHIIFIAFAMGCSLDTGVSGAPVSSTTLPSGQSSLWMNDEQAMNVRLDDFRELLDQLESVRKSATNSLTTQCNLLNSDDLPPGFTCVEYAQYTGTKHVTCSRPISNPVIQDGIDRSLETSTLEVLDGITGHRAMLDAILALPRYSSSPNCMSVNPISPDYFICRVKTHQRYNRGLIRTLDYILDDMDTEDSKFPERITCTADNSVQKKAPLGVLWKVQKDAEIHKTNMRIVCEQVKLVQEVEDFSCA